MVEGLNDSISGSNDTMLILLRSNRISKQVRFRRHYMEMLTTTNLRLRPLGPEQMDRIEESTSY